MVNPALVEARLVAQGLAAPFALDPVAVVAGLGAMQGQDLPGVLGSIALRLGEKTVDRVVGAFNAGEVVRGYPMRGTVFALPAADAAWITELCAGPQRKAQATRWERLGVTPAQVARAREIFFAEAERGRNASGPDAEAASGSGEPSRAAGVPRGRLKELWERDNLLGASGTVYSLITGMVIEGLAVYGPLDDRDHLVVPAETWLPAGSDLAGRFNGDRVAATAELLRRYLNSHGPASLRDFLWWTKLPQKLVKPAFELVASEFEPAPAELVGRGRKGNGVLAATGGHDGSATTVELDTQLVRVGLPDEVRAHAKSAHGAFLLPGFDELTLGYADRLAFMAPDHHELLVPGNNGIFRKTVVRGGKFLGTWLAPRVGTRSERGRRLELEPFSPLSQAARGDVERTFKRFPHF